jgi:hypothetical protein
VKLLVAHGAELDTKTELGLSALMVAERSGGYNPLKLIKAFKIYKILRNAGAKG